LTTFGRKWNGETAWNYRSSGLGTGESGGGVSTIYAIPIWQQGVSMSANGGSTSMRNLPDVSMVADDVWCIYANGQSGAFGGTSVATPLWAGFTALVNQQNAALGRPPAGFINPAIYALGKSSAYASCFHDVTTGNNTNSSSPTEYYAVPGYDLCTGWGTPTGSNLINALVQMPEYNVNVLNGGVGQLRLLDPHRRYQDQQRAGKWRHKQPFDQRRRCIHPFWNLCRLPGRAE
jgi:subtilase family serine protease